MSRSAIDRSLRPWVGMNDLPAGPDGSPPPVRANARIRPTVVYDPHRYAKFSGEQFVRVSNSAPGTLILPAPDTRRNALILRNISATANIYVAFGSNATSSSALYLTPKTMILFDTVVPQDDVFAIADAASASIVVAQSVIP